MKTYKNEAIEINERKNFRPKRIIYIQGNFLNLKLGIINKTGGRPENLPPFLSGITQQASLKAYLRFRKT